ncbi:60S ribosomal protein L31-like [Acinonyx jubatus]|uniref:60S ribosomal protein L31-like n=1 Tax=Acinonyx jubatus TaxID=32536 RepID=A0ABM3PLZ9_ACIJB|nr:60S ribosomal protein L31-like [Acinonyx jubatus]
MALARKGGKKISHPSVKEAVTREHTVNTHKHIQGMCFRKHATRAFKEIQKSAMKEKGTPYVHFDTRLSKAVWAKGGSKISCHIQVQLSRKYNEDEESPNKLYTLIIYMPVTTFKVYRPLMWMRTNH